MKTDGEDKVNSTIRTIPKVQFGSVYSEIGSFGGLTKREYFAGLAMQAYISKDGADENSTVQQNAEWVVKCADALINALNKEKP